MAFFVKCEGGNLGTGIGGSVECEGGTWVAVEEGAVTSWTDQLSIDNANEILAPVLMLWAIAWCLNKLVNFAWSSNFGRF